MPAQFVLHDSGAFGHILFADGTKSESFQTKKEGFDLVLRAYDAVQINLDEAAQVVKEIRQSILPEDENSGRSSITVEQALDWLEKEKARKETTGKPQLTRNFLKTLGLA